MPYRFAQDIQKPSEQLDDLLRGKVAWRDAPESIRSWAQIAIHEAAVEILKQKDKAARQKMLGKIPAAIRPKVEAQIMKLWSRPITPTPNPTV